MTTDEIQAALTLAREAKEKAGSATVGPWIPSKDQEDGVEQWTVGGDGWDELFTSATHPDVPSKVNAAFIAHARTAVPALCAAVEAMAAEIEEHDSASAYRRVLDAALMAKLVFSVEDYVDQCNRAEKAEAELALLADTHQKSQEWSEKRIAELKAERYHLFAGIEAYQSANWERVSQWEAEDKRRKEAEHESQ